MTTKKKSAQTVKKSVKKKKPSKSLEEKIEEAVKKSVEKAVSDINTGNISIITPVSKRLTIGVELSKAINKVADMVSKETSTYSASISNCVVNNASGNGISVGSSEKEEGSETFDFDIGEERDKDRY